MLGIAKGAIVQPSPPPPTNVEASIAPSDYATSYSNGTYVSPYFKAVVSNGAGPYIYNWSVDAGTALTPSDSKTRVQLSGYNSLVEATVTLKVIDTGDSNKIW